MNYPLFDLKNRLLIVILFCSSCKDLFGYANAQ